LRGSPLIGSGYLQTAEQLHVGDVRWTRADIWLNDAIIVLYFRTIKRRADLVSLDRVLVVDTLFHAALTRDVPNDKQDDKWRKLFKQFGANQDLFSATSSVESVLVPVNVGVSHWVLVHINMNLRRLEYFDSLGGSAAAVLNPVW
jgi:Ulp1 family protease